MIIVGTKCAVCGDDISVGEHVASVLYADGQWLHAQWTGPLPDDVCRASAFADEDCASDLRLHADWYAERYPDEPRLDGDA